MRHKEIYRGKATSFAFVSLRIRLSKVFTPGITSREAIDRYLHLGVHLIAASFGLWKQVVAKCRFLSLSILFSMQPVAISLIILFRNCLFFLFPFFFSLPTLYSPRFSARYTSVLRK